MADSSTTVSHTNFQNRPMGKFPGLIEDLNSEFPGGTDNHCLWFCVVSISDLIHRFRQKFVQDWKKKTSLQIKLMIQVAKHTMHNTMNYLQFSLIQFELMP